MICSFCFISFFRSFDIDLFKGFQDSKQENLRVYFANHKKVFYTGSFVLSKFLFVFEKLTVKFAGRRGRVRPCTRVAWAQGPRPLGSYSQVIFVIFQFFNARENRSEEVKIIRSRIHERTIAFRFLGKILRVFGLEVCMVFLNHWEEGGIWYSIRFSSFLL